MNYLNSADEHARLVDAAKARALELRQQAVADFWAKAAAASQQYLRNSAYALSSLVRHVRLVKQ